MAIPIQTKTLIRFYLSGKEQMYGLTSLPHKQFHVLDKHILIFSRSKTFHLFKVGRKFHQFIKHDKLLREYGKLW